MTINPNIIMFQKRSIPYYATLGSSHHVHETVVEVPNGPTCKIIGHHFYPIVAITTNYQPIGFESRAALEKRLPASLILGIAVCPPPTV